MSIFCSCVSMSEMAASHGLGFQEVSNDIFLFCIIPKLHVPLKKHLSSNKMNRTV